MSTLDAPARARLPVSDGRRPATGDGRPRHRAAPARRSRGRAARGVITGIERFAVHDGPGLRTVVFFKGCPLRCVWCHSPETQAARPQVMLRAERCLGCGACLDACASGAASMRPAGGPAVDRARCTVCGRCADACPTEARTVAGERVEAVALLARLERDAVFHGASGGGVTFSGGEPLRQPAFLAALLDGCRQRGLDTAVETSGYAPWAAVEVASRAGLVLFDLKLHDDARHREHTGVSNRRVLANFRRLASIHPRVRVRLPFIPGITDAPANVAAIGREAKTAGVAGVDLLPYHAAGSAKYLRLGRPYALSHLKPPTPESLAEARRLLEAIGLDVSIGGGG